jgi:inhibitor of cysteine peptidase
VKNVVQQEVKKKTRVYGTVAILSAIILVTLIYTIGSGPVTFPPTGTPTVEGMKRFSSYEALRDYLVANATGSYAYNLRVGPLDEKYFASEPMPEAAHLGTAGTGESAQNDVSHSTTNIQVEGVDEADIVKNDGNYIYTVATEYVYSETRNVVYIVKADPQDPKVVAKITLDNKTYPAGLYLSGDSSKLVVIASIYQPLLIETVSPGGASIYPYQTEVSTFLYVYDISDKASPVLARNFTISGSYFNSRMIGNYVYAVVSQSAQVLDNAVTLPRICETTSVASKVSDVEPSRVYYADTVPSYFTFTTFLGLNIMDDAQEPTNMTLMMGGTSTMYVSTDNVYVTYPTWSEEGQFTSIYRVRVDGSDLEFEAEGSVAGYVLNQYSMDEYNNYFRVTTTWQKETTLNYIYVLDMNLTKVGELLLPKFEERETIQSTRFMGDKCYVVTFEQKDPFFVIDMSNPTDPKVAGQLKIPGYSSYLHPYDENHVIGLGMENSTVKLSLFDVTNVNAPTETAKYIIDGDWTYSDALYEPKAFLFDKQKDLLVIPVSITQYGYISGTEGTEKRYDMEGGYWQGAYVFKLTLDGGFEWRDGITHQENATSTPYMTDYNTNVNRALFIGNTLYTVSNAKIKLNSLTDLSPIAEVKLD